jgi:hypothetical protein
MQCTLSAEPDFPVPPDAAARGILLAVMLSSVLWLGLALTAWTLWWCLLKG